MSGLLTVAVSNLAGCDAPKPPLLDTESNAPDTLSGVVRGVMDGDTVKISDGTKEVKCRLAQIDAPEKSQQGGKASKKALSDLIFGKTVSYIVVDTDQYKRSVCKIYSQGEDINAAQLKSGNAWVYTAFNKDPNYVDLQNQARQARLGLWSDQNPIPPWEYRKSNKTSR